VGAIIATVIFAVGCAGLNRLRGSTVLPALLGKLLYGIWVGSYFVASVSDAPLATDLWQTLVFAALWAAGASPGWGNPMGRALLYNHKYPIKHSAPERWQVGILRDNVPLALAARGAMWGAAVAPMAYWLGWPILLLTPIMAVALTAAPYISAKIFVPQARWAPMEVIKGALFGLLAGPIVLI
jgi:hypothetical protein